MNFKKYQSIHRGSYDLSAFDIEWDNLNSNFTDEITHALGKVYSIHDVVLKVATSFDDI